MAEEVKKRTTIRDDIGPMGRGLVDTLMNSENLARLIGGAGSFLTGKALEPYQGASVENIPGNLMAASEGIKDLSQDAIHRLLMEQQAMRAGQPPTEGMIEMGLNMSPAGAMRGPGAASQLARSGWTSARPPGPPPGPPPGAPPGPALGGQSLGPAPGGMPPAMPPGPPPPRLGLGTPMLLGKRKQPKGFKWELPTGRGPKTRTPAEKKIDAANQASADASEIMRGHYRNKILGAKSPAKARDDITLDMVKDRYRAVAKETGADLAQFDDRATRSYQRLKKIPAKKLTPEAINAAFGIGRKTLGLGAGGLAAQAATADDELAKVLMGQ